MLFPAMILIGESDARAGGLLDSQFTSADFIQVLNRAFAFVASDARAALWITLHRQ